MNNDKKIYLCDIEKLTFYKNRFLEIYRKNGMILSKNKLDDLISRIDEKLAVFSQGYIKSGETMNLEKFNEQKADLYQDFKILYSSMYELAKDRLEDVETTSKCVMEGMKRKIDELHRKTAIECLPILGDTLYQKTNFNDIDRSNANITIIRDIPVSTNNKYNYLYVILKTDGNHEFWTSLDNRNRSVNGKIAIPVTRKEIVSFKEYETEEDYKTSFQIQTEEDKDTQIKYTIFAGLNHIKGKVGYISSEIGKFVNDGLFIVEDGIADFYILNSSFIEVEILQGDKNLWKSFNGNKIEYPDKEQKISIRGNRNVAFRVYTDGNIYADRSDCVKQDDGYYSLKGFPGLTSFCVKRTEWDKGDEEMKADIYIDTSEIPLKDIEFLAVKGVTL